MSIPQLVNKLHLSRSNTYNIFDRESIDTELLYKVSEALKHNFFNYYIITLQRDEINQVVNEEQMPYFTADQIELRELRKENEQLRKRNYELTDKLINAQEFTLETIKKKELPNPAATKKSNT
jgi:hypothetical protein